MILERTGRRVAVIIPADEFQAFRLWQESRCWPQRQLDRLQAEQITFRRLLPELLKTHPGQLVAIRDGRVVDADPDERALARRVLVPGQEPVYIQEVRSEPRIYDLPSPRSCGMYRYDTGEHPQAPRVTVKVTDPATGSQAAVSGKLDTGAAISVLPIATVAEPGLMPQSDGGQQVTLRNLCSFLLTS